MDKDYSKDFKLMHESMAKIMELMTQIIALLNFLVMEKDNKKNGN